MQIETRNSHKRTNNYFIQLQKIYLMGEESPPQTTQEETFAMSVHKALIEMDMVDESSCNSIYIFSLFREMQGWKLF